MVGPAHLVTEIIAQEFAAMVERIMTGEGQGLVLGFNLTVTAGIETPTSEILNITCTFSEAD